MPKAANPIPINPAILTWARETAGYTINELSDKPEFKNLADWETGLSFPTYSQLEKIAAKFHRPLAVFFFPAPPEEEPIENSLRVMSQEDSKNLTPGIRHLFKKAKAFQISLRELLDQKSFRENKLSWLVSLQNTKIVKGLPEQVREELNISVAEQLAWHSDDEALKRWRDVLAENGLFIFKDAFKNENLAGFCIYDSYFPIIYINNSMSKNRQIFTIFHELAHIIFQQSFLDTFDNQFKNLELESSTNIEARCNAFAGEFLVPNIAFDNLTATEPVNDKIISDLAKKFHVSREVILRRYLDHKLISREYYQLKVSEWQRAYSQSEEKTNANFGGDYYNSKISYLGDAYLSLVLQNYNQGRINIDEAALHLDIKPNTFPEIEERFTNRGGTGVRF